MSKYEEIRKEKINKILASKTDDGRKGKAFELENARKRSKKIDVAGVNENDGTAKFLINGKVKYIPVEFKTNGGRIDNILEKKYVVYRLDLCNSTTSNIRRYVDPVIIPSKIFVDFLYSINAVKVINKNGVFDGYGIQANSKKLYLALLDWIIPYDKDTIYTDDDFDGLTL